MKEKEVKDTEEVNIHDYINEDVDSIKNDIIMGKDFDVIANKWEVSKRHVENIASRLRNEDKIPIPKRNSRDWRVISVLRREDI